MLRLSTNQMYNASMNSVMQSYQRASQTNNQMSSGKRMLTPADDPVAAAQTLNTKNRLATVQQYNTNVSFADKNLSQTESVLNQIEQTLTRMKEMAIQLGSDQWSDQQVKSTGLEVKETLKHLQGLLNTRNESGEYIFAGSQADQKAYEGNQFLGDRIERQVQVSDDTLMRMLTSGARAFENLDGLKMINDQGEEVEWNDAAAQGKGQVPSGALGSMLGVMQYFVNATGNGNPAEPVNKAAIRASVGNLDVAFEQVSKTRAQIGSRQNTLEAVKSSNQDFALFANRSLAELEDLDYAEAYVRMETAMMSYQAGLQVTGKIANLSLFNYI